MEALKLEHLDLKELSHEDMEKIEGGKWDWTSFGVAFIGGAMLTLVAAIAFFS